jgi:hypothetical protein
MKKSGQVHDPTALPPGKKLGYPLNRRLSEKYGRCEAFGEEKNFSKPITNLI